MKTILLILITIVASQYVFEHYGRHNVFAATADCVADGIRWTCHSCLKLVR